MNRGKFITIEGVEGAGKSTNLKVVQDYLSTSGIEFVSTREPGGTEYGEAIRNLLLNHYEENLDSTAELLLIFAARAQHLNSLIEPALEEGKWVLSDRFTDASYAYQGAGRNLGFESVSVLENFVQGDLRPDLTLVLDLPVDVGMRRVDARGDRDRFEAEKLAFFERVRNAYLKLAAAAPERYTVIDTLKPLDEVKVDIIAELHRLVVLN